MTEQVKEIVEPQQELPEQNNSRGVALLVYVLLLGGIFFMMTSSLIAVVIAYIYRDDAPPWLQSHFQLQVRTFWISFLYLGLALLTWWFLIGYVVFLFWLVWYLVRCIKGIRYLNLRRPYPDPESWWI